MQQKLEKGLPNYIKKKFVIKTNARYTFDQLNFSACKQLLPTQKKLAFM